MTELIATCTYTRNRVVIAATILFTPWKNQRSLSARNTLDSLKILVRSHVYSTTVVTAQVQRQLCLDPAPVV